MTDAQDKSIEPKRRRLLGRSHVIAIGLAVAAAGWILSGVVTGKAPISTDEAEKTKAEPLTLVRVQHFTALEHTNEVVLFGRTEATEHVELSAETAGQIVRRPGVKGAWTKKGAPLVNLATDDRMARLEEAKAKLAYQEIAFNAAMRLSKKQFQSQVRLAEEKAKLETAKAALAAIRLDLARTTLSAPIDGFIETLPKSVGDYVAVGEVVATIVKLDPIRIVGQVSERDVARLQRGGRAQALLPGGRFLEGRVEYVSRAGEASTRTFRVEVWIANPDGAVSEGLTAELRLPVGIERAHRVSPAVLTLNDSGVIGVKAVEIDGEAARVVFHPVQVIGDTSEGVWLSGLPATIDLITVGQEFVSAGQAVRIKRQGGDAS